VSETVDTNQLLVRIFEMLRMHQEAIFKASIEATAAVEALKESDPQFAEAYDRHFWAMKQGQLGEENAIAVRIIDQIKRQMRHTQGQAAAGIE
jgi:hypothetical protein